MIWRPLLISSLLLTGVLAAAEPLATHGIEIIPGRLDYPREAELRAMDGYAKVVIEVDETGRLVDYLVVEASHDYFVEGAEDVVRRASYHPARVDGRAVPLRVEVPIEFKSSGIVVNSDFQAIVDLYLQGGHVRNRVIRMASLRELDRIPVPLEVAPPPFPLELAQRGVVGEAVIDFYIDQEGKVRMPAVVEDDFAELGSLALEAVRTWRFEPPQREGHAVIVRVRQTFQFRAGSPVAQ